MTDIQLLKPTQGVCTPAAAAQMITQGRVLLLAGAEANLATLPQGCWIGGTAGHFLTPDGGMPAGNQVFYTDFTGIAEAASWRSFDAGNIHEIAQPYPAHGFAILILPGFSRLLNDVAGRIMEFDGLYNLPLMGWVSAVALDRMDKLLPCAWPKTFAGGVVAGTECAAVLYVSLPRHYFAQLNIANLFSPGTGPDIQFLQAGHCIEDECLIGGKPQNLADYMVTAGIDKRLPLVADHEGALLNVSIASADATSRRVIFLAPVSPVLTYRFAEDVLDYEAEFVRAAAELELEQAAHSCICALHFRYAGLNGAHYTGPAINAPVTFGQIAYTVLNQTLTCLTIGRAEYGLEEFSL